MAGDGRDGRSAPREDFLHELAQLEVWPDGEATGGECLVGVGRRRAGLDKGERLLGQLEHRFRVGGIERNTPGLGIKP